MIDLKSIIKEKAVMDNINFEFTLSTYEKVKYYMPESAKGIDVKCPKCGGIKCFEFKPIEKVKDRAIMYCNKCDWKKNIQIEYLNKEIETIIVEGLKVIDKEKIDGI